MPPHSKQHTIPKCYLKAWCDPKTPAGHSPYVWHISKDGSAIKNRSPEKSFTATDRYTITLPNGQRELVLEETLSRLEGDFVGVLSRVRRYEKLTDHDRARLCTFAAAMCARTYAAGGHWRDNLTRLRDQTAALAKARGAGTVATSELDELIQAAPQVHLATTLKMLPELLFPMAMTVVTTRDELGFITSDQPCVWWNPEAYKRPPFFRSPGLAQKAIEVILSLGPHHAMLISHHHERPLYAHLNREGTDEINRIVRFHCHEEFVSWKGETRPIWFDPGVAPDDAWENTPEAKTAAAKPEAPARL